MSILSDARGLIVVEHFDAMAVQLFGEEVLKFGNHEDETTS